MKRWILAVTAVLGVSLLAIAGIATYTAIGRSQGFEWGSLNGPEPVWPAVVGFGAMNVAMLSGIVLAVLCAIAITRASKARN